MDTISKIIAIIAGLFAIVSGIYALIRWAIGFKKKSSKRTGKSKIIINKPIQETRLIHSKIKSATVAIVKMEPYNAKQPFTIVGSGCCIDPQGIVITCRHVLSAFMSQSIPEQISNISPEEKGGNIRNCPPISLTKPYVLLYRNDISNTKLFAFPIETDIIMAEKDYDLGLLRMLPHKSFPNGYPHIEVEDYENITEEMEIGTCGFPLGNYLTEQIGTVTSSFTKGIVSSIIPAQGVARRLLEGFQLNLTATHGNSGGPVYSHRSGKVFAVVAKALLDSSRKNIFSGLIKAEPIYPLIDKGAINAIKNASRKQ